MVSEPVKQKKSSKSTSSSNLHAERRETEKSPLKEKKTSDRLAVTVPSEYSASLPSPSPTPIAVSPNTPSLILTLPECPVIPSPSQSRRGSVSLQLSSSSSSNISSSTDSLSSYDMLPPLGHKQVSSGSGGGCPFIVRNRGNSSPQVPEVSDIYTGILASTSRPLKKKSSSKKIKNAEDDDNSSSASGESEGSLQKMFEAADDSDDDSSFDGMDAAELKSQLRVLKRINNFTRDIAENSTQAIVVVNAASHKIFWVNGRAQFMFGKLAGDMIDQNVNILIPDEIARKHDRIMDNFMATWAREGLPPSSKVVNPRAPRDIKAVRYMSDGSKVLFDAQIYVRYVKNGSVDKPPALFVAYLNDITETKVLKQQLKLSKVIQEKSAEAIVVCDLFGQITSCNAMMEKMFGYSLSFLLAHNKNIKWFTPKKVAEKHDLYMASFRDNLNAGYDVLKSTIIAKSRDMKGRRPGESDDELFSIVLRVEQVGTELVAYIRDVSDTITKSEFDETIAGRVFPKCMRNKVLRKEVDPYEICEALTKKTVVYTDLVNFSKYANGTDIMEVYTYINTMYKAFDKIITQYAGELVKRTGDGIIAIFGLDGKASKHADRAIYCSIAMMQWAEDNAYKMRIGVATGNVGSGVFGDGESRPAWDVLGECVNLASRMQSCGVEGHVQVTEGTMEHVHDPRLRSLFVQRAIDNVKGYGHMDVYLSQTIDYTEIQPLMQRRKFEIDHEKRRIMEREKRLVELGDHGDMPFS